jgi:hypothetical protein
MYDTLEISINYYASSHKGFRVLVFNPTFNNISVILWWSVLLVEVTGIPGEHDSNSQH